MRGWSSALLWTAGKVCEADVKSLTYCHVGTDRTARNMAVQRHRKRSFKEKADPRAESLAHTALMKKKLQEVRRLGEDCSNQPSIQVQCLQALIMQV